MRGLVDVPLMTRRMENHKDDAMEELMEVYEEVKDIETCLTKTINIAHFIMQKHHTLLQDCLEMKDELDELELCKYVVGA